MNHLFKQAQLGLIAIGMLGFISCKKDMLDINENTAVAFSVKNNPDVVFYALGDGNVLDKYNAKAPETVLNSASISGIQANEEILSIDFRPATGQMYGISNQSRLYVINAETGKARMIGTGPFTPTLTGEYADMDFNPTVDRIRVVTSSGQNLRLNPETGTVAAIDGNINGYDGAMVTAVAYTNNVAGAATTTLYDIDIASQQLFKQIPPNNGTLVLVDSLYLKVTGQGGFDISPDGIALGLYEVNKKATLFSVDISTGRAKMITKYDKGIMYHNIAIPTNPVAYSISNNSLVIFNPTNISSVVSKSITGLQTGETIMGLDFRPLNGQLYALGSSNRIYSINASSGAAAMVAVLSTPLNGTDFGFDFNPLVDRIRIVSNSGQNLRFNPNDGALIIDGNINPSGAAITASAYSNNFAGTTSTTLYAIDVNSDKLYIQSPPNNGTLVEVGSLGINIDAMSGFDIGGTSNNAYALLSASGSTKLYIINKSTGAATALSNFPYSVSGFTIGLGF
ncbi:MAG: DUF4394 domain-containing protein [Ferruginibacter sp.]